MENKTNIFFMQIFSILTLNLAYPIIANEFSYMGFTYDFNFYKVIAGSIYLLLFLGLMFLINDKFISSVWNFSFLYLLSGEVIYFQYATFSNPIQILSVSLFLILLVVISRINLRFTKPPKLTNSTKYISVLSILMFIPFLIYINDIDLSNLLLLNVYETRADYREINNPIIGYLRGPLVRILLPYLIVINLEKRQFWKVLLFISMLLYVYLVGALKSVFFGLIAVLFFYRGSYYSKIKRFFLGLSGFIMFGVIYFYLTEDIYFLDIFVRRIFFVPAYLNTIYNNYFTDNFTELSHSAFGLGLSNKEFPSPLPRFVGDVVMGEPGLSANVGVFTEGYISLGFIGLIIFAIILAVIFLYLKMLNLDDKFFGIIIVYVYYLNTAFLSTLLLTHGLLFLLIFSYHFIRSNEFNQINLEQIQLE